MDFNNFFKLPRAKDEDDKPSAPLWFVYYSFFLASAALINSLVKSDPTISTLLSILFFVLCMVFYRIRNLDKVKLNLKDQSLELDGEDENVTK